MWLTWECLQLPAQYNTEIPAHLALLSPASWLCCLLYLGLLSSLDICPGFRQPRLEVDAVEEGDDAAASCTQCKQFHIQGQELLCLLDKKVLPNKKKKAVKLRAFTVNVTHCVAAHSRFTCLSPAESLYLYIPAEFQTLHRTPWAFVPSLSQVHWAAAPGWPRTGQG